VLLVSGFLIFIVFFFFLSVVFCFLIDVSGDIGPFQLAIILTVVTLALIIPWNENYGHDENESERTMTPSQRKEKNKEENSFFHSIKDSLKVIYRHPQILLLGLSQAFFEGAVYTFGKSVFSFFLAHLSSLPLPTFYFSVYVGSVSNDRIQWTYSHWSSFFIFYVINDIWWNVIFFTSSIFSW
jgi:hypothetical protein